MFLGEHVAMWHIIAHALTCLLTKLVAEAQEMDFHLVLRRMHCIIIITKCIVALIPFNPHFEIIFN